jgi:hypothetical protein
LEMLAKVKHSSLFSKLVRYEEKCVVNRTPVVVLTFFFFGT